MFSSTPLNSRQLKHPLLVFYINIFSVKLRLCETSHYVMLFLSIINNENDLLIFFFYIGTTFHNFTCSSVSLSVGKQTGSCAFLSSIIIIYTDRRTTDYRRSEKLTRAFSYSLFQQQSVRQQHTFYSIALHKNIRVKNTYAYMFMVQYIVPNKKCLTNDRL